MRAVDVSRSARFGDFDVQGTLFELEYGGSAWHIHSYPMDKQIPNHQYWVQGEIVKAAIQQDSKMLIGEMPVVIGPDEKAAVLGAIATWTNTVSPASLSHLPGFASPERNGRRSFRLVPR